MSQRRSLDHPPTMFLSTHSPYPAIDRPENLRRSVTTILAALRGTKRLDLFESARVDPKYRIEDTIAVLSGFVKEGLFDHIGLSECRAETLRRAHAVRTLYVVVDVAAEVTV